MHGLGEAPIAARRRVFEPEPLVHRHDFLQIVFPQTGRLDISVERTIGAVAGTDFVIVQPGDRHVCWSDDRARCLVVDLPRSRPVPAESGFRTLDARSRAVQQAVLAELDCGGLDEPLVAGGLARYLAGSLLSPRTDRELVGGRRIATLARDVIDARFDGRLTAEELATKVGASVSHLQRSFKAEFGVGIVEYTIGRRLERAAELLERTDSPISRVASESGFESTSYFSTRFARRFAESPARYRARFRAESRTN